MSNSECQYSLRGRRTLAGASGSDTARRVVRVSCHTAALRLAVAPERDVAALRLLHFGVALSVVDTGGLGSVCGASSGSIFQLRASFIPIQANDSATDSRQEPLEVILHARICAVGRRQRRILPCQKR